MNGGYEIFALFMRYVFVALGGLILWRSFRWLRKDARAYRKEIKSLPDAGLVGEMVDMNTGKSYPLPREGVLGASRSCDIRVTDGVLSSRHLTFLFVEGKGLAIRPLGQNNVTLDGEMLFGTGYALHGTRLEAGSVTLRVRLFAGLNVPRRVLYQDDPEEMALDEPTPFEELQSLLPHENMWQPEENAWEQEGMNPVQPPVQDGPFPPAGVQERPDWQAYPQEENGYSQDAMQMNGPYVLYPPEAAEQVSDDGAVPEEIAEEEYVPPFEMPKRKRRSDKYL